MTGQDEKQPKPVYILITQCLQNNFFLSTQNRLRIPEEVALRMLFSGSSDAAKAYLLDDKDKEPREQNKRIIKNQEKLKSGPLYEFFKATIGSEKRTNHMHVIHVRDWHHPSENYDFERKRYGSHCEADTWEAKAIDGFEEFLEPWSNEEEANEALTINGFTKNNNTYYDVRSNSLFDFRGDDGNRSLLYDILDKLILMEGHKVNPNAYVVVVGVLTDIKIKLTLTALRSNYDLDNLVTSDVLTASTTLERHLSGLDFADKVLNVEIIHDLNALASVLFQHHKDDIPAETIKFHHDFRLYKSYYLDKQNILSYQDDKLIQYLELTSQRGAEVYDHVFRINKALTRFGFVFLWAALVLAVLRVLDPERFTAEMVFISGGLSTLQFVTVFINRPTGQMQENLNNLVRLRNYLETYSTITALLRHHLTTPENLQGDSDKSLDLGTQMSIIQGVAERMSGSFYDIQLGDSRKHVIQRKQAEARAEAGDADPTTLPEQPESNDAAG